MKAPFCAKVRLIAGICTVVMVVSVAAGVGVHELLAQEEPAAPAAAGEVKVRKDHPRIWVTPEKLAELKARAAANTPEWQELKQVVDRYLDPKSALPEGDYAFVANFGLVYLVTGDVKYSDRSIQVMKENAVRIADDRVTPTRCDIHTGSRGIVFTAVGYDWNYGRLTPQDRAFFVEKMNGWTDIALKKGWLGFPAHNYYYDFLISEALVGLATAHENDKAPDYLADARRRFETTTLPLLASYGKGGYWGEGLYYGSCLKYVLEYAEALKTATGEDLNDRLSYFDEQVEVFKHATLPDFSGVYPSGDWTGSWGGDNARPWLVLIQNHLKDPQKKEHVEWWLQKMIPKVRHSYAMWTDFLEHDPEQKATAYVDGMLTDYLAEGAGLLFARSDRTTEAVWVSFQAGDKVTDHQHRDQNSFSIYHKGWQAREPGSWWSWTSFHNTITIDGKNQVEGNRTRNPDARLVRYEPGPDYTYALGEASQAYLLEDGTRLLDKFEREFVFLKPRHVVVFDRIQAANPNSAKNWHLQSASPFDINANRATTTTGGGRLFLTGLLPQGSRMTQEQRTVEAKPVANWTLTVQSTAVQSSELFLTVLEATDAAAQAPAAAERIDTTEGKAVGVRVGDRLVFFGKAGEIDGSISYTLNGAGRCRHLVIDLKPGREYKVRDNAKPLGTFAASKHGTLVFEVKLGGTHALEIAPVE